MLFEMPPCFVILIRRCTGYQIKMVFHSMKALPFTAGAVQCSTNATYIDYYYTLLLLKMAVVFICSCHFLLIIKRRR